MNQLPGHGAFDALIVFIAISIILGAIGAWRDMQRNREEAEAEQGATAGGQPPNPAVAGPPPTALNPGTGADRNRFGRASYRARTSYRRWSVNIRKHTPGDKGGSDRNSIIGDGLAAIAGALAYQIVFGAELLKRQPRDAITGRTAGDVVNGTVVDDETAPDTTGATGGRGGRGRTPTGSRPGTDAPGADAPGARGWWIFGRGNRHSDDRRGHRPGEAPGTAGRSGERITKVEQVDDGTAPDPPRRTKTDDDIVDAEIVEPSARPVPQGTALTTGGDQRPTQHQGVRMPQLTQIFTIFHLFRWASDAHSAAAGQLELANTRARAALTRAEQAVHVAQSAEAQAVQLANLYQDWSVKEVDAASLASIVTAWEHAKHVATLERARAEAEQRAADAAASAAAAIEGYQGALASMAATVHAHQTPHAEAQAVTGNKAAHHTVLEIS